MKSLKKLKWSSLSWLSETEVPIALTVLRTKTIELSNLLWNQKNRNMAKVRLMHLSVLIIIKWVWVQRCPGEMILRGLSKRNTRKFQIKFFICVFILLMVFCIEAFRFYLVSFVYFCLHILCCWWIIKWYN